MRVTTSMNQRQTLADLYRLNSEYTDLLHEQSSGSRLNRPSDDPGGAVRQLQLRAQIAAQNDGVKRLDNAGDDVSQTESAVSDGISIFQRANELCLEAANSSRTNVDFAAIATEADQLLNELVSVGNRRVGGRFMFAGSATTTTPFVATGSPATSVSYNGNANQRTVSPSPGLDIIINMPGDQVFMGSNNTFNALIALRDAAKAQNTDALGTSVLTSVNGALDQLINVRTRVGAIADTVNASLKSASLVVTDMDTSLARVEDADLVDVLTRLASTETAQTATLKALSKSITVSLLDYLA